MEVKILFQLSNNDSFLWEETKPSNERALHWLLGLLMPLLSFLSLFFQI